MFLLVVRSLLGLRGVVGLAFHGFDHLLSDSELDALGDVLFLEVVIASLDVLVAL